jgi:CRP/FNR family transcriptional regulator, cyclic AMP receptor protein
MANQSLRPLIELDGEQVLASRIALRMAVGEDMVWPNSVRAPDLFQGVSPAEARKIATLCAEKWFLRGAIIFSEGDPADALYVLNRGLIKLICLSDKGRETILHILKPDEVFGELLLSEETRPFTAMVIEDALVTILSRDAFLKILTEVPTVTLNFVRLISQRLANVERGLAEFSHTWSYHRLAKVLLRLGEQYGREVAAGTLLNVRLTHEDLANLIGTSRETVTTQLNRFARLGLLRRQARRLIVNKSGMLAFIQSEEARLKNLGFAAAGSR